ncbi:hypothetical protein Bca52824_054624 [Brassica carinata]|uniref:ABC transporter A family member 2/9/11 C-terminal domain-containing protein n=1 Tax=Brassica carinata TaxID=52824 RepID=A0A8X7RDT6_BRACI|nr:hypothetical protein Bca52824_054624 [Brassica carinata]
MIMLILFVNTQSYRLFLKYLSVTFPLHSTASKILSSPIDLPTIKINNCTIQHNTLFNFFPFPNLAIYTVIFKTKVPHNVILKSTSINHWDEVVVTNDLQMDEGEDDNEEDDQEVDHRNRANKNVISWDVGWERRFVMITTLKDSMGSVDTTDTVMAALYFTIFIESKKNNSIGAGASYKPLKNSDLQLGLASLEKVFLNIARRAKLESATAARTMVTHDLESGISLKRKSNSRYKYKMQQMRNSTKLYDHCKYRYGYGGSQIWWDP